MKLRGLIAAMIVLLALLAALYWSNRHPKSPETTEASAEVAPKILSLKQDDISKIELKKKDAAEIVLARNNGQWQITAPQPLGADQSTVSSMLSTLSSLNSDRLVEDKASNLSQYGLTNARFEADITEKDNKTQKLLLGDKTPSENAVYAKLDGDPRVFTIATYEKTSIDKSVNDLRDKRLIIANQDKISKVELSAKKQDIEFGRNKDEWQIVKPKPLRADGSQVEDLLRNLTDAKMELSSSDDSKKIAAAFTSATPIATAKITDESGTQELQVLKSKDDYYAKSSVVDGIYKVPSSLGQAVDKGLDDFRNKRLFDFGYSDPNTLELHDGPKAYFLTRGGEDWWNGSGQKLDMGAAQSLVDKARDLSATKFVDSGFTQPVIDLTVISNDSKRTEKVLISKNGDNYVAKRDGEPALYELDSKVVSDLQKAAAELKMAAPVDKSKKPAK
ncbi:MAG TPA: DUF4340 domain-containing protein [Terriglobales bacterium]|nr:DUF4340 domain-containing protein [Terriglobales bacterium]